MEVAKLYGYIWSSCTWRVRAALYIKQIPYMEVPVDIVTKRINLTDDYRRINPAQKVPALVIDGVTLVESMAILQYLEDSRPTPRLSPATPLSAARMREICETIVAGIQPLQNVGLKPHFSNNEEYIKFTRHWTERGLQTLEELLRRSAGTRCVGNDVTMADLCLVPQLYNAVDRHKLDITKYATVNKLYETLSKDSIFEETHPLKVKEKAKREINFDT